MVAVLSVGLRVALPAYPRAAGQRSQRRQRNSREPASSWAGGHTDVHVSPADGDAPATGQPQALLRRFTTNHQPGAFPSYVCSLVTPHHRGIGALSRLLSALGTVLEGEVSAVQWPSSHIRPVRVCFVFATRRHLLISPACLEAGSTAVLMLART
ncbi:hypothetical protein EV356DRAFT_196493 [Viridothelium virens]|uniref:Uncharacterized protein n=1 Tax=Viridothelium virens TaxID=1048519 RepID=A0A6A6H7F5_VIRVR|nr:hypothetical protein EV356DRAFT_196493 [Viridothelium virens]